MSKSKHANKIVEDHDGTFYCLKCGQAGFKTKASGYGHLTTCKGYKSAVNKITKELKELGLNTIPQTNIEINRLDGEKSNADEVRSTSAYFFEKSTESGPSVGHPRATLGPPSGSPSNDIPDNYKIELMRLRTQNELLQKVAFNHNQHYPQVRQTFSGPQDMVNSSFGDLMENKTIRLIVTLGALAVLLNFVMDQFDKLDKRSKNKRNK